MKFNQKIFESLTRPADTIHESAEKKVEIYFMNETEEGLYANAGKFALWSSDGTSYKVLIQKEYYDYNSISKFYVEEVNFLWADYFKRLGVINKKMFLTFLLPIIIAYIALVVLAFIFFRDHIIWVLVGLIVVVFILNFFQNKIMDKKFSEESTITQTEIKTILGDEIFSTIAKDQEDYHQAKAALPPLDDEDIELDEPRELEEAELEEEETIEQELEQIEETKEDLDE